MDKSTAVVLHHHVVVDVIQCLLHVIGNFFNCAASICLQVAWLFKNFTIVFWNTGGFLVEWGNAGFIEKWGRCVCHGEQNSTVKSIGSWEVDTLLRTPLLLDVAASSWCRLKFYCMEADSGKGTRREDFSFAWNLEAEWSSFVPPFLALWPNDFKLLTCPLKWYRWTASAPPFYFWFKSFEVVTLRWVGESFQRQIGGISASSVLSGPHGLHFPARPSMAPSSNLLIITVLLYNLFSNLNAHKWQ